MLKGTKPTTRLLLLALLCLCAVVGGLKPRAVAAAPIKVGIFQNKPLVYFEERPQGLFVEVLDYVAQKEGWQIEYIQCELKDCLRLLKANDLDLMTSVGESPDRLADFSFSREPVWTFWGTIYSHDHNIHGVFDLRDKRIGVRRANIVTSGLKNLLAEFNIPVEYVEYDNYEAAYAAFIKKEIEAIAVNNTYGFDKLHEISAYKTPIVFNPFSAYFAAPKNGRHLDKIAVIDRYMQLLKADKSSLLHAFNQKWFGGRPEEYFTARTMAISSGLLLLLTILSMAVWRYLSIVKINKNLSATIAERQRAELALQRAHAELEERVAARTKALSEEIENRNILEKELSREKAFLEAVLNNIADGVVACNQAGVLTLFNRASREFHGLPEAPIPAEQWADHYDLYRADGVTRMVKTDIPLFRALHGENVKNVEMVIAPKQGKKRLVQVAGQPLTDSSNHPLGAVASMHDVTEQKEAEALLRRAHQELERKVEERTRDLQLSYEKLEREIAEREKAETALRQSHKMEAIGTLAGGIAHDFNNILGIILGYADMAKEEIPEHSPAKEQLEQILKAGLRATDLVRQILTFSRKEPQERIPTDVGKVVKEAIQFLRASIPTTIELKENIASHSGNILADQTQIQQVLINLCTNAAQALGEKGGVIEVVLAPYESIAQAPGKEDGLPPGPYVQLSVTDNGPGIAPGIIDRIFDPYFTTKEVGKGSGMGLAVVLGIIKSHEGIITVASEAGAGTTFSAYFPRIKENPKQITESTEPLPTGREKILLIDDEASIVEMTSRRLKLLGYRVTATTSSTEALELFRTQPTAFDLVISDQTMPGMTGSDLAKKLLAIRPDLPIILCSGYSATMNLETAAALGIKAFIMKPINKKELAETIRASLESRTS